jgi:cytochrome P450
MVACLAQNAVRCRKAQNMPRLATQPMRSLPPGPKPKFLIGNALDLAQGDWLDYYSRCAREYGDVVFFRFLNVPMCLLVHPDDIEEVLVKNTSNFVKSRDYRALKSVLGEGLLTSESALWQRQRKLVQPLFRRENIEAYSEVIVASALQMLARWRNGETRDIHQEMTRVTLEVAAKTLFGADVSQDADRVGRALRVVSHEFLSQASLTFFLPESFPLPGSLRLRRAARELDSVVYSIIRERRAAKSSSRDLLQVLLAARSEDGRQMSDRQLRDEMMTLFLAGHETTAIALSWTWRLLAENPDVEAKLFDELQTVLGGRPPRASDLPRLPYTEMVVKESLRLYPPAWGIGRQALKEFEVHGYLLPARTNVFMIQWITHRDPRFFPDPAKFVPERWRDDPIRSGRLPRFSYFPFGGGPRVCVGAGFAMMEVALLLAAIAQKFRLALAPGASLELLPTVTLRPKQGIQMILHDRPLRG